jgi:hypothetical protein
LIGINGTGGFVLLAQTLIHKTPDIRRWRPDYVDIASRKTYFRRHLWLCLHYPQQGREHYRYGTSHP